MITEIGHHEVMRRLDYIEWVVTLLWANNEIGDVRSDWAEV